MTSIVNLCISMDRTTETKQILASNFKMKDFGKANKTNDGFFRVITSDINLGSSSCVSLNKSYQQEYYIEFFFEKVWIF